MAIRKENNFKSIKRLTQIETFHTQDILIMLKQVFRDYFVESSSLVTLGKMQRIFLVITSFVLATVLLLLRTQIDSDRPLDFLARNSLEPQIALQNGQPTIIEFYADWCDACNSMAPSMMNNKSKFKNEIDIVLLNVDNPRWLDLIKKYEVNGIPQVNFFDETGTLKASSIGLKSMDEIDQIIFSLLNNKSFPELPGLNDNKTTNVSFSTLRKSSSSKLISPRSHS